MSEKSMKITDENLKDLHSLINEANNYKKIIGDISLSINDLEGKKIEVINKIKELLEKTEEKAKSSIIEAGISKEEVEEYTLDIAKGEIITRESAAKQK